MARVGVFVCHCGENIGGTVDCARVAEMSKALPGVVHAVDYKYMCSDPGQALLKQAVEEKKLDGVVVAACSPRMHEPTFRRALQTAGINPYFLEMANIREQCSWVHDDPRAATDKAIDLVRAAVRRVVWHEPLEKRYVDILRELAALAQGRIGVQTNFTVEQEHRLLAGADMIVMPSQYEPCGLTQMRAQRYGALPVARRVGGLADTIDDNVTGFLFDEYSQGAFINACARAIDHYRHPQVWTAMVKDAMSRDFGWHRSEMRYRDLYRRAIAAPRWRR